MSAPLLRPSDEQELHPTQRPGYRESLIAEGALRDLVAALKDKTRYPWEYSTEPQERAFEAALVPLPKERQDLLRKSLESLTRGERR